MNNALHQTPLVRRCFTCDEWGQVTEGWDVDSKDPRLALCYSAVPVTYVTGTEVLAASVAALRLAPRLVARARALSEVNSDGALVHFRLPAPDSPERATFSTAGLRAGVCPPEVLVSETWISEAGQRIGRRTVSLFLPEDELALVFRRGRSVTRTVTLRWDGAEMHVEATAVEITA